MDDNKKGKETVNEYHAPVYNINIGYVAKQINGVYCENHYHLSPDGTPEPQGKTSGVESHESVVQKTLKPLFALKDRPAKEDREVREREAKRMARFVEGQGLGETKLSTSKSNRLTEVVVAFVRYWQKNHLISQKPSASSLLAFLRDDVGLKTDVTEKTFVNHFPDILNSMHVAKATAEAVAKC